MRSSHSTPRPKRGRPPLRRFHASFEPVESRLLLTTFTVTTTADSGPGSLRAAITASNTPHSGADAIDFAIPASTAPNLDVPVAGFDPVTQTWKIALTSALPPLMHQVTIDGYTEGQAGIPFRYPSETETQTISIVGTATGGTYTLTTQAPLPVGTTADASPSTPALRRSRRPSRGSSIRTRFSSRTTTAWQRLRRAVSAGQLD